MLQGATSQPQLDLALRIAAALTHYWHIRDLSAEIRDWVTHALDQSSGDPAIRTRALYSLGFVAATIGEWQQATLALRQCLEMCPDHGDARAG